MLIFALFLSVLSSGCGSSVNMSGGSPSKTGINMKSGAEYVPGELLVKFRPGTTVQKMSGLHKAVRAVGKKDFKGAGVHHIKLPKDLSVEEAVESYVRDADVEYAEPNYLVHAAVLPDDHLFNDLWGLNNTGQTGGAVDADIDAPEAWDTTRGSHEIIIAVIDSGLALDHPDFSDNLWINDEEIAGNGLDDDGNGYIDDIYGWDFIDDDGFPDDLNSHGTHVSGTIAAAGNNGRGISGVMWRAKILPLRFLGISGTGSTADAISAILYANEKGAHIINNSWGGSGFSQALKDVIDASGAVVVCAAGNSSVNNDMTPFFPASFTSPNVISVAATDHNDSLASFSNYGTVSVDIGAPGENIYSTIPLFSHGTPVTVYSEDFDGASGNLPLLGWDRGGTNSTWAVTSGTGKGGTNSLEDSPGGNYQGGTNSRAWNTAPFVPARNNRHTLSFQWRGRLESGSDFLDIIYSHDGLNWSVIDYLTGSSGAGFISYLSDITTVPDNLDSFYLGFGLFSDTSIEFDGVYIDNVKLTSQAVSISGYNYGPESGASMAAPHVSGVAGLIMASNPALSSMQVKDIILDGADLKASFSGLVLTGGRLNARNSVLYSVSPDSPSGLTAKAVSGSRIDLNWTDNSDNDKGFRIERRIDGEGVFSEIAEVISGITEYSDSGLVPGTVYYYRVGAYNIAGSSGYSNEAEAMTLTDNSGGDSGGGGKGCFIATAAYGSPMHPYVKKLRLFRDRYLMKNPLGRGFVELYYKNSPPVADAIRDSMLLRTAALIVLVPIVMFVVYPYVSVSVLVLLFICLMSVSQRLRAE
jgi:subtilisin family serine protease